MLKAPLPRPMIVVLGLCSGLLWALTLFGTASARILLLCVSLGMSVIWGLFLLWGRSRAIVLEDEQLTTRWIARRRLARADLTGVETSTSTGAEHPVLVRRDGRRVPVNLVASAAETRRLVVAIRDWIGVDDRVQSPVLDELPPEDAWQVPAQDGAARSLALMALPLLLVPVSMLWHHVPWWGWVTAAGLAVMLVKPVQVLRGSGARFEGDELVLSGHSWTGYRERRVRARDIIRVVTVSELDQRQSLLQLQDGDNLRLPTGDQLDRRSAATQRWAEIRGGGGGGVDFRQRRPWDRLALHLLFLTCFMGSIVAAAPHVDSILGAVMGPLVLAVWNFVKPPAVVRDWSDHA